MRFAQLGRYAVLRHLASGGMAEVLLGRSDAIEGFERHVVLKRIRPEFAHDRRFIRMFLDEARVAATLHHQHIVQVYDVGESNGEYFIAMEYIHPANPDTPASEPAPRHVTSKKVVISTALTLVLVGVVLGSLGEKRRQRVTTPAKGSNAPSVSLAPAVTSEPGGSKLATDRRAAPADAIAPALPVREAPVRTASLTGPAPGNAAIVVPPSYGLAPSPAQPVASGDLDAPPVAPVSPGPATAPSSLPAAPARRVVVAAVLEANRTGGENEIPPDRASRAEMRRSGRNAIAGVYKICLAADGKVETVRVLRSTGYPAYDIKIESTIFSSWRYRPVLVDGKPGPVCSSAKISWSLTGKLGNKPTWE